MKTTCMVIKPDGVLCPLPEEQAVAQWRDGSQSYWIDLEGARK